MRIHFLGGVDTVTGSRHIIEAGGRRVLRDFGLYQGRRQESNEINRRLPFAPGEVDAMVLSHAHLDHCGNIPTLARNGFSAPILSTTATAELARVMLLDSANIQEQDAAYLNQKTNRQGLPPVEPLYTIADAEAALKLFRGHHYEDTIEPAPGIRVTVRDAGHILGAALHVFEAGDNGSRRRVGFAFDLGRKNLPLIRDPELLSDLDALVLESTYGDRLHDDAIDAQAQLAEAVRRTIQRRGKVIIPSFALERAQEVIYHLVSLVNQGRLPRIPIYVDSPMATEVTRLFEKFSEYLDADAHALRAQTGSMLRPPWVHFVGSVQESKQVTTSEEPCIVIAASGMCEHGRILHHLKQAIGSERNTILIVGFQASYTLGRRLVEQAPRVRIFGDEFERRAEVVVLNAFSGHADRRELTDYVNAVRPRRTYLVHGEPDQRAALAATLREAGHPNVFLPSPGDVVDL